MATKQSSDTASENAMMEKFIIDSVVMWAKEYKVDGFRFDTVNYFYKDALFRNGFEG